MQTELDTSSEIRKKLIQKIESLMNEVKVLHSIIQSSRKHFKNLENKDFDELQNQLDEYKHQIELMNLSAD